MCFRGKVLTSTVCKHQCVCNRCSGQSVFVCLLSSGLSRELLPSQSDVSLSTGPSPTEPALPAAAPQLDQTAPVVPVRLAQFSQSPQSHQSSFYRVLLSSGALCLPGETNTNLM